MNINSDILRIPLADKSVDLVFCSPPYEDARTYGINFAYEHESWIEWAIEGFVECQRVCRGLVAWVVDGRGPQTENWSGTPVMMMADMLRMDIPLWKPPLYGRYGLPGKFRVLRNLYEFVICSSGGYPLPWSDVTAMGGKPVCKPGGRTRPRKKDGSRNLAKTNYKQPDRTNAGNWIWCGSVGGGNIGSKLAHENEAPFSEKLAEFFIRSFCPPGGIILDPFGGSGTTAAMAIKHGRRAISSDIRISQCELTARRLMECAS